MSKPNKTEEELRQEFLDSIHYHLKYWENQENVAEKDKLWGLALSILTIIDGMSTTNGLKHYTLSYGNTKLNADTFLHDEL